MGFEEARQPFGDPLGLLVGDPVTGAGDDVHFRVCGHLRHADGDVRAE